MDGCERTKLTTLEDANDFPVVNSWRTGYYRVDYEEPIKSRLFADAAKMDSALESVDLTGMLSDSYGLDLTKPHNVSDFLNLSLSLGEIFAPLGIEHPA